MEKYIHTGIWGGHTITRGERGFIVENYSTVKGFLPLKRMFVYGRNGVHRDTDFGAIWGKDKYGRQRTVAEHIADVVLFRGL